MFVVMTLSSRSISGQVITTVTTVAGPGTGPYKDGICAAASFGGPVGVTGSSDGSIYVAPNMAPTVSALSLHLVLWRP